MNIFEYASDAIIKTVSENTDGMGYLSHNGTSTQLPVLIEKDVAIINEFTEVRGDDAYSTANTATFDSTDVTTGDTLRVHDVASRSTRTWIVGRTLEDDGFLMTVIVT